MRSDKIILEGKVIKCLPNSTFIVKCVTKNIKVLCHLSGKMKINFIRLLVGDFVKFETYSYNNQKGRIIYRIK
ncbi:translation initiation factor IF-1 [Candidatus Vidania fulgoroideorum]